MPLLKRICKEALIGLGLILPVMVGLGCMLGFGIFRRPLLDIQVHNTYFVLRPWELVLLVSWPLWLFVQLVRGVRRWWLQ